MRLGATEAAVTPVQAQTTDPGQHFSYGMSVQLAANGQASARFQVQNWDFETDFITANSQGNFTVRFRVGDRYLSNIPVLNVNLFGNGQSPMPMALSRIKKNDIVYAELVDKSGAQNQVDITFIGRELQ